MASCCKVVRRPRIAAGDVLSPAAGEYWNAAQKIWQAQAPTQSIAFIQPQLAVSKNVTGYVFRSEGTINFAGLSKTS